VAAIRLERRLAAILAADVVGYSRLLESDEAGTYARLRALRKELVEPILERHRGRFVDLKGDGAIVEFRSAVEAVEAAVEIQQAVAVREADEPEDRRLRYRIGVNLADLIVDDQGIGGVGICGSGICGSGINIAARIEALCEPGGVWLSSSVHNEIKGKLDLVFVPSGRHQGQEHQRAGRDLPSRARWRDALLRPPRRRPPLAIVVGRPHYSSARGASLRVAASWPWSWRPAPSRNRGRRPRCRRGPTMPEPAAAGRPGIAVLPFVNLGGDEVAGRLADGVTEDVITDLARFRDLDVIARNSTEVYEGKPVDVRQVGRDLGVGYVLEGSIQQQGGRVRVTVQLVSAGSGVHLWSERWDRPAEDVFAVQAEVAERVATTLAGYGVIADAGRADARRRRPEDLTAYDLYLLGAEAKHRATKEATDEAIRLLTRAVETDPNPRPGLGGPRLGARPGGRLRGRSGHGARGTGGGGQARARARPDGRRGARRDGRGARGAGGLRSRHD
jgi:TolB-like protein/class 3 adenylate cyclase